MPKTIKEQDGCRITEDDVGRHLKSKMQERRNQQVSTPIYTYPSNGLPKLSIKGPNRPK